MGNTLSSSPHEKQPITHTIKGKYELLTSLKSYLCCTFHKPTTFGIFSHCFTFALFNPTFFRLVSHDNTSSERNSHTGFQLLDVTQSIKHRLKGLLNTFLGCRHCTLRAA